YGLPLGAAGNFGGEGEEPSLPHRRIEAAEIVEGDLRRGKRGQPLGRLLAGEITEQSVAEPAARHGAQALLDGLDRLPRAGAGRQLQSDGKESGEPADGAREVDAGKDLLAA